MSLLALDNKDERRYPVLFLWRADKYYSGTWSAILRRPRTVQWRIFAVNLVLMLVFLSLFVAVGTPILGKSYTWWLLALAAFVVLTLGTNCIKLLNHLIDSGRNSKHE